MRKVIGLTRVPRYLEVHWKASPESEATTNADMLRNVAAGGGRVERRGSEGHELQYVSVKCTREKALGACWCKWLCLPEF